MTCSFFSYLDLDSGKSLFKNLKEMYLHKTLLSKWSVYLEILTSIPLLEILNFSDNKLFFDQDYEKVKTQLIEEKKTFNLRYLVMNKSYLDINGLIKLSFTFTNLRKLYLFSNNINEETELNKEYLSENFSSNFSKVEFLSLENNNVKDILKVYEILSLPNLKYLNVNKNKINALYTEDNKKERLLLIDKLKKSLVGIYLESNQISDYSFLSQLSMIDSLEDIYIMNNNFPGKNASETVKMNVIGKFLNIKILNNTTLLKDVKKDFELMYLKHAVKDYFVSFPSIKEFKRDNFEAFMKSNHITYYALRRKYFDPLEDILESEFVDSKNTIKGNTLEIVLLYGDKTLKKKFPKSITLVNLRNVVSKLFKIESNFNFYVLQDLKERNIVLDEARPLEFFNIANGDIVEIK